MEKKSTGHTVYQQIRRVSVLGILVAMVLATGAGLSLNLLQERRIRDDTLTTAVQAVSHTLTITNADDVELVMEYVDRTVHGISGIDLFAVYDTDGTPVYFCDITESGDDASTLETLDSALMERLDANDQALLDNAQAPKGADHCAYAAVHRPDGSIKGYVMAGLYIRSIRDTGMRTLGIYILIGMAALSVGSLLSLRLAQRIKSDLLGYEPDAFRDLFLRRMELLDALDEGLLAIDREEHIIYINRAAAEMLSFDKETVIGKPLSQVYPQSTIPRVLDTEQPEYNISLESLHHVRILSDRMPVRRDGQIVGAVAIFRNRTEVANLARELTGVQHIVEAMRAYTHEFMNKLHIILGYLQTGESQKAVQFIMNTSLVTSQSIRETADCIRVSHLCALIIGKMMHAAELGILLTVTHDSFCREEDLLLSPEDYATILGNLLENAIDELSRSHSEVREIKLSMYCRPDCNLVVCEDTGGGIAPDILPHIWDKGFSSKGEGRGFGLYLISRLVDEHGGCIELETEPGVGTCFTLTFTREE